jgi:hypothetical protein
VPVNGMALAPSNSTRFNYLKAGRADPKAVTDRNSARHGHIARAKRVRGVRRIRLRANDAS